MGLVHRELPATFIDCEAFVTPTVTVGEFRCTLNHPRFEDSGPIRQDCFVFPRLAVAIQHEHDRAFVANPNVVTYYNAGQVYRREAISPEGDHCHWFAINRQTVCEVLEHNGVDPGRSAGPFAWSRGPADPQAFLAQRDIVDAVRATAGSVSADPAEIEERVVLLFERAVQSAAGAARKSSPAKYRRSTRDAIHHVEVLLSARWNEPWLLSDLAEHAGLSVFHLCRAFRAVTGRTVHQYRLHLRLRSAVERLRAAPQSLVEVALEAGFCSHSHFTSAFRREFGAAPSGMRRPHKAMS